MQQLLRKVFEYGGVFLAGGLMTVYLFALFYLVIWPLLRQFGCGYE